MHKPEDHSAQALSGQNSKNSPLAMHRAKTGYNISFVAMTTELFAETYQKECIKIEKAKTASTGVRTVAVSYTHLDVYKRQLFPIKG